MGPRSGERGNFVNKVLGDCFEQLQWGRVRVNAEIGQGHLGATLARPASMGPRSGERGNVTRSDPVSGQIIASMGPRSGERGNAKARPFAECVKELLQWGRV